MKVAIIILLFFIAACSQNPKQKINTEDAKQFITNFNKDNPNFDTITDFQLVKVDTVSEWLEAEMIQNLLVDAMKHNNGKIETYVDLYRLSVKQMRVYSGFSDDLYKNSVQDAAAYKDSMNKYFRNDSLIRNDLAFFESKSSTFDTVKPVFYRGTFATKILNKDKSVSTDTAFVIYRMDDYSIIPYRDFIIQISSKYPLQSSELIRK